jgi:hypothetical protein
LEWITATWDYVYSAVGRFGHNRSIPATADDGNRQPPFVTPPVPVLTPDATTEELKGRYERRLPRIVRADKYRQGPNRDFDVP